MVHVNFWPPVRASFPLNSAFPYLGQKPLPPAVTSSHVAVTSTCKSCTLFWVPASSELDNLFMFPESPWDQLSFAATHHSQRRGWRVPASELTPQPRAHQGFCPPPRRETLGLSRCTYSMLRRASSYYNKVASMSRSCSSKTITSWKNYDDTSLNAIIYVSSMHWLTANCALRQRASGPSGF